MKKTTKIIIYFELKKVGHKFDVYLENETLTVSTQQTVLFTGTVGGFKAAILNKNVMHSKRDLYNKIYLEINTIVDKLGELLAKAHTNVHPPLRPNKGFTPSLGRKIKKTGDK